MAAPKLFAKAVQISVGIEEAAKRVLDHEADRRGLTTSALARKLILAGVLQLKADQADQPQAGSPGGNRAGPQS